MLWLGNLKVECTGMCKLQSWQCRPGRTGSGLIAFNAILDSFKAGVALYLGKGCQ
jgi:hypothetical protein